MNDDQVWDDLSRFAQAMKRGAEVVFCNGDRAVKCGHWNTTAFGYESVKTRGGICEIIEPAQKKVRPLNAEEWKSVAGCIFANTYSLVPVQFYLAHAQDYAAKKLTCHPPGFPSDVRNLWVEE